MSPPSKYANAEEMFWARVRRGQDDAECWGWVGHVREDGRPFIVYLGKFYSARAISWELHNGPVPPGHRLGQTCQSRGCCNPAHLQARSCSDIAREGRKLARRARPASH